MSFENMSLLAVVDPDANRAMVLARACQAAVTATDASELLHGVFGAALTNVVVGRSGQSGPTPPCVAWGRHQFRPRMLWQWRLSWQAQPACSGDLRGMMAPHDQSGSSTVF